tara:strand:+ start:244 stop:759 length:516 start_codon:yes stop_codon:yes gene_type:complete
MNNGKMHWECEYGQSQPIYDRDVCPCGSTHYGNTFPCTWEIEIKKPMTNKCPYYNEDCPKCNKKDMTLIEKTLKSFGAEYSGQYNDFSAFCCKGEYCMNNCGKILAEDLKAFITKALQEQDRESTVKAVEDLQKLMGCFYSREGMSEPMLTKTNLLIYAKQHNIDLKQDEN